MIRGQVQRIDSYGHGFSVGLSQINRNDLVVLLASARLSGDVRLGTFDKRLVRVADEIPAAH